VAQGTTARYFFILIGAIGGAAIFSSTLSKTPVLPLFAADLGATPVEIGWIVIASTIPGILAVFILAPDLIATIVDLELVDLPVVAFGQSQHSAAGAASWRSAYRNRLARTA
jgi:hypothetical protein